MQTVLHQLSRKVFNRLEWSMVILLTFVWCDESHSHFISSIQFLVHSLFKGENPAMWFNSPRREKGQEKKEISKQANKQTIKQTNKQTKI